MITKYNPMGAGFLSYGSSINKQVDYKNNHLLASTGTSVFQRRICVGLTAAWSLILSTLAFAGHVLYDWGMTLQ